MEGSLLRPPPITFCIGHKGFYYSVVRIAVLTYVLLQNEQINRQAPTPGSLSLDGKEAKVSEEQDKEVALWYARSGLG